MAYRIAHPPRETQANDVWTVCRVRDVSRACCILRAHRFWAHGKRSGAVWWAERNTNLPVGDPEPATLCPQCEATPPKPRLSHATSPCHFQRRLAFIVNNKSGL